MTRRPIVHQFTAVLAGRDAVGQHTLAVDDLLVEMGCDTTIFAAQYQSELASRCTHFRDHPDVSPPDLLIYQASTGSPVAEYVLTRHEPLVLNYHNLTPAEMFDPWEPHVGAELAQGRRQLARLARRARCGVADSRFNADELTELGLADVVVAPVLWGAGFGDCSGSAGELSAVVGESPVVLFVGRVAPNKCHEDLISAFAVLVRWWPGARLVLVGASSSVAYLEALEGLAVRLGVAGSVVFAGSVSDEELVAWYSSADVFVCVSEHEGFCVPLVEAMAWGVPVVAFGAAAVPETVGDAGIVLGVKDPVVVASAVDRVFSDVGLREELVGRGRLRAECFDVSVTREVMREALAPLLATTP